MSKMCIVFTGQHRFCKGGDPEQVFHQWLKDAGYPTDGEVHVYSFENSTEDRIRVNGGSGKPYSLEEEQPEKFTLDLSRFEGYIVKLEELECEIQNQLEAITDASTDIQDLYM